MVGGWGGKGDDGEKSMNWTAGRTLLDRWDVLGQAVLDAIVGGFVGESDEGEIGVVVIYEGVVGGEGRGDGMDQWEGAVGSGVEDFVGILVENEGVLVQAGCVDVVAAMVVDAAGMVDVNISLVETASMLAADVD